MSSPINSLESIMMNWGTAIVVLHMVYGNGLSDESDLARFEFYEGAQQVKLFETRKHELSDVICEELSNQSIPDRNSHLHRWKTKSPAKTMLATAQKGSQWKRPGLTWW